MVHKSRRWLIDSIQRYLMPAFEERGFEIVPLSGEEGRSREIRTAFPFGHLRRMNPRGFDIVEIQLDKHRDAAFRLNIGIAPLEGIDHAHGYVKQEDIRVHFLSRYYEAYSWPRFRRWFAVRRWFGAAVTRLDYDNLVADNLGLVEEVENVLRDGKRGRHIRVIEI